MSARILVVDDNPLNVKLLVAKLSKDYYVVVTAENGIRALQIAATEHPDLILLDVMMPEMDGLEVCQRLKADHATSHIPVIMITALTDTADRVRGLEAGADDFLSKPINDLALTARVRSLLRLKMMMDEWRLRQATAEQFEIPDYDDDAPKAGARTLLLEDDPDDRTRIAEVLESINVAPTIADAADAAFDAAQAGDFDLVMISLNLRNDDGLMLCAKLRAQEATRNLPILMIANGDDTAKVAKGLDLGANEYILRPIESSELIARARTQLRHKSHYDRMRRNYEQSLALALVDPLTGAYNRRYLDTHLPKMLARYRAAQRPLATLSIDIDHFKRVNDTYGHPAGDIALKEVVNRISQGLRPMDLVVRMGGEEFAVILPETDEKTAINVGERLREAIAARPINVPLSSGAVLSDTDLDMTVSIGVAVAKSSPYDMPEIMLRRADEALYRAKEAGRNMVVSAGE